MNHSDACTSSSAKRLEAWNKDPHDIAAQRRLSVLEAVAQDDCKACGKERREQLVQRLVAEAMNPEKSQLARSA